MQAYIDESVSEGHQFVFAGFIGQAEQWAAFADRWEAVLKQPPAIQRFKFRDFESRDSSFSSSRLSETDRKRRVSELVATMTGAGFTRISVTIGLPAFAEMSGSWSGIELAHPYCYAFQVIIGAVAFELLGRGHRERFEILFDENDTFRPKAKKWYPLIRELCVSDEVRSILPVEPIFRSDDESVALQAADLYAGLVRSGGGERNAATDVILSKLLVCLSGLQIAGPADARAQAEVVRKHWDNVTTYVNASAAAESFAPIATRLKKSLSNIGSEPFAEHTLAPIFAAVDSIKTADDPDGFNWIRQELAEGTILSAHSQSLFQRTKQQALDDAMRRWGITPDQLDPTRKQASAAEPPVAMPDVDLNRAIALLDEPSIESFRRAIAKKRARKASKAARRTPKRS